MPQHRGLLDPLLRSPNDAVVPGRRVIPPAPVDVIAPVDVPTPALLDSPVDPPSGGRGDRFGALEREFGIDTLQIGQVPMAEADFNLRRRLDAENRREAGLGVLQDALNRIGTSEGEIAAREVALQRLRGGGLGAGAMRGQLAQEQEANLRALSEQFAQRGLGGGVPAVGMAEAAQRGRIGAASAEAAFRENLQRSALQDIQAMNQDIGNRRLAAQDLLQRYLGEWELPPIDLSALAILPEDAMMPIGGMLPGQPAADGTPAGGALPGGPGDPNIPNTWGSNEDGSYQVPEGHAFAGCRLVVGPCANQQGGCRSEARGTATYVCPDGHPQGGGSHSAGASLHTIMRR